MSNAEQKKFDKLFGPGNLPGIKPVFYILILLLFSFKSEAQENLVPNGSFEEYDWCPIGTNNFQSVKYWYSPTPASPDYYNSCDTQFGAGVPNNDWGYQFAADGNAYAGIILTSYQANDLDYREYLQVKLKSPLTNGELYCWSLNVSLLDNCDFASNCFALAFCSTSITSSSSSKLNVIPFFIHTEIITDSLNWVKLSGQYEAVGGEEYLTIGNFSSNTMTEYVKLKNNSIGGPFAYYYVDNVKLIKCEQKIIFPNVFTPNNDEQNDRYLPYITGVKNFKLRILNRWGNEVFFTDDNSINWDGSYQQNECSPGIYFYVFNFLDENNKENRKTGFIHLIR